MLGGQIPVSMAVDLVAAPEEAPAEVQVEDHAPQEVVLAELRDLPLKMILSVRLARHWIPIP